MRQEGDLQRIIIFLIVTAAVALFYIIFSIAQSKILKKAGLPGWMGFVPYLSTVKLFDICWEVKYGLIMLGILTFSSFFSFLFFGIPTAIMNVYSVVLYVNMCLRLAKSFGKSGGFAAGLIILPFVFLMILGFDKSEYLGKKSLAENTEE